MKMNCENLQFNLSLYIDDGLSVEERQTIENHLPTCPLCRQKVSEYKDLRNDLRMASRPAIPANLLQTVRSAVANEINQPTILVGTQVQVSFSEKIAHWIMPYSVGTVAATVFAFVLLTFILTTNDVPSNSLAVNDEQTDRSVLLANSTPDNVRQRLDLPPEYQEFAIANYQPKVNPTGALVALTKSIVRGNIKDEEVVIVADVFGNGLARITEVVEPPNNDESMDELERAFQTDPNEAPFLPASNKQSSGSVRVILKIQRVDVIDLSPNKKIKKHR